MKRIIGLTGPTGAGKTTVTKTAKELGMQVIDCDQVAREAVLPGTPGLCAAVEAFGAGILLPDGSLDRKALARLAFSSPENTERLNRVLLPHIATLIGQKIGDGVTLLDAPTLFESGMDRICETTVAVLCDRGTRLKRIMARDGIDRQYAELRLNAGKPDTFYSERAGHIIYNNGSPAEFETGIAALLKRIMEE